MEQDLSAIVERGEVEAVRVAIGKLTVQPGDVLVLRRCDGLLTSRAEAARIREEVLKVFETAGWQPALLFVDGFELAVVRGIA